MQTDSIPGKGSPPGYVFKMEREGMRGRETKILCGVSSIGALIPFMRTPPS